MTTLITADMILDFDATHADYLAIVNGETVHLDDNDIAEGTAEPYNYVTTTNDDEAQILLDKNYEWFPDAVDEDGDLLSHVAHEMADIINADAGLAIQVAVETARELGETAERDAEVAHASAMARAFGVVRVVELCGGNQSEAARRLGIDQSTVNKLARKVRAASAS